MRRLIPLLALIFLAGCYLFEPEPVFPTPEPKAPVIPRPEPEPEPTINVTLKQTDLNQTAIDFFNVTPVCRYGEHGGEIRFRVGSVPKDYVIEVKEPETAYREMLRKQGVYENSDYFSICDDCLKKDWEFNLEPGKVYIMRVIFDQTPVYDRLEYSGEFLINTTTNASFVSAVCESKIRLRRW